jgi:hypothetical protein
MKIKLQIKIPKGWYVLKSGSAINRTDRIPYTESMTWHQVPPDWCDRTSLSDYVQPKEIIIRKKKR